MQPGRGEVDDDRDEDDEVARDGEASHRTERGDRVGDGAQIRTREAAHRVASGGSTAAVGGPASVSPKRYQRPFHQPHAIGSGRPPR